MKSAALALSFALLVSACETMSGVEGTQGGAENVGSAFDLGDWRHAAPADTLSQFQTTITARYSAGSSLSAAAADLRRNDFNCAADNDATGRGTPPVQICRKTVTAENCTGTWQVHLFDTNGDGRIAHARALYDRRCGAEGLLGGPS
jgi:hypothetical protein